MRCPRGGQHPEDVGPKRPHDAFSGGTKRDGPLTGCERVISRAAAAAPVTLYRAARDGTADAFSAHAGNDRCRGSV